jgi:hypothetical protein
MMFGVATGFVVFAIKLVLLSAMAFLLAMALVMVMQALLRGALPETKEGLTYTRSQNPMRFWFGICGQGLFIVATAVMIDAVIHIGLAG